MDLLDKKTDEEILQTLVIELAKAKNEIACAQRDVDKATNRLGFLLVLTHNLINRTKD